MMSSENCNGTRVWVKRSAVEAVQNPRLSFKEKMARKPSVTSSFGNGSLHGSMHGSFTRGSFNRQASIHSSAGSVVSFSSQRDPFGDTDSEIGSVGIPIQSNNRSEEWEWMIAYMIDSSNGKINLQFEDQITNPASSDVSSSSLGTIQNVALPATALSDGDIVMANEYQITSNGSQSCPDDLISLSHLHEPAVVECLQRRYEDDLIYTATGPVLLALNPFQSIRGLYGESTMKKYWEKAEKNNKETLPPHVYAIADEAFRCMMRGLEQSLGKQGQQCCDQSILVSGESGAGKTVTTKFVMKYLAALSQRAGSLPQEKRAYQKVADKNKRASAAPCFSSPQKPSVPSWVKNAKNSDQDSSERSAGRSITCGGSCNGSISGDGLLNVTNLTGNGAMNSIEAQVLQSNPILESFGNARTMRNDNSSRFGKFIEIQFTRSGRLVGAQIETYLLEKVRLVTQSPGERNYHIFYEMLSGAMSADELRNYFIASTARADDFKISASGTYDRRDGVSDKETYRSLRAAMKTMKFSGDEQMDIFAITAAILHASNLNFVDMDQFCSLDGANVHLEPVCHLLGVSPEDLNQALCHLSIKAGKETQVQQNLSVGQAEKGLEALLKATYGALFTYLVSRINDSISFSHQHEDTFDENGAPLIRKEQPSASIGVLDIFGFESFKTNSFEQLCINYCNEALQQQFNAFVLKNEQAEYEREGIEWSFIEFPENQDVIDLIDKRGSGILCILDDQCRAPGTSDRSLALDVYNKCKSHARFSANRKQTAALQFCVHHYAGPVEYSTDGFVEKNRDELPKEATELLQNSLNPFVRLLAQIIENATAESSNANSAGDTPHKLRRQESTFGRVTVGGQFRRQLRRLREKIDQMSPHYVRCLKPNDDLVANHFERSAVAEQLRCGGILEAVRVARAGYSNHYSHEEFLRRYRCLAWSDLKPQRKQDRINGVPQPRKKWGPGAASSAEDPVSPGDDASSAMASCNMLVKSLYRIMHQEQNDDRNEKKENSKTASNQFADSSPAAKAKSYAHQISTPPPAWARGGSGSLRGSRTGLPPAPSTAPSKTKRISDTWEKSMVECHAPSTPEPSQQSFAKNIGGTSSSSEWAKVGIQIGKTKVFLRHKAFETLERLRGQELSQAAVKLNSVFRMYLARVAYVHVRNAVRKSMHDLQAYQNNEWKETKEQDPEDERLLEFFNRLNQMRHSYGSSLVEVWASQMRESIHNPVPRSQWGKIDPSRPFKWMLVDGLWIKNHDFEDSLFEA
jgi:myosin-5